MIRSGTFPGWAATTAASRSSVCASCGPSQTFTVTLRTGRSQAAAIGTTSFTIRFVSSLPARRSIDPATRTTASAWMCSPNRAKSSGQQMLRTRPSMSSRSNIPYRVWADPGRGCFVLESLRAATSPPITTSPFAGTVASDEVPWVQIASSSPWCSASGWLWT